MRWLLAVACSQTHIVCNKTLICSYTHQKLPAHTCTGVVGMWVCSHVSTEQFQGDPLCMQEILSCVQLHRTKYINIYTLPDTSLDTWDSYVVSYVYGYCMYRDRPLLFMDLHREACPL